MKIIELLIVLFLIFILVNFYTGRSQNEKNNEIIKHQKIYMESQEKLKKATETMEKEYEKYKD
ncbi:hypothetical protein NRK67_13935 [Fusobacteria bacterium ZRK30]|nr:hypothetical protein NRK67_13935 [Fusobacteria bacterium ZRK30]